MKIKAACAFWAVVIAAWCSSCSKNPQLNVINGFSLLGVREMFDAPLHSDLAGAVFSGDDAEVVERIKRGADVNAVGKDGVRPLFIAIQTRSLNAFELLLNYGADANVSMRHREGREVSVMELTALCEDPRFLEQALRHGGMVDFVMPGGRTIIYEAIMNNRHDNVRLLVERGANLTHQDSAGETPLMTAAAINQYRIAFYLLENGADPTTKNRWGFDLAARIAKYGDRGVDRTSGEDVWFNKTVAELRRRGLLKQ